MDTRIDRWQHSAVATELRRQVIEREESLVWERAAADPAFWTESQALEETYRAADLETWPPETVLGT